MDIAIRIVYYAACFAVSFYAGRTLGRWLNKLDRESKIAHYHRMNNIRERNGLDSIPPSSFGLWGWEVDPAQAHLKPTGER